MYLTLYSRKEKKGANKRGCGMVLRTDRMEIPQNAGVLSELFQHVAG
jgi:hypothetical protein